MKKFLERKQGQADWVAKPWMGYAVAVGGTVMAALVRWAIGVWVGEIPPFITFYPVALAAAVLGGTGAGLLATLLSALAVDLFFVEPAGMFGAFTPTYAAGMGIFIGINIAISIVGGRLRRAHQRVQAQNAQLKHSEEQLRLQAAALESAANAIIITDRDGAIQWTNPAFTRLTGYTAAEVLGRNPRLLKSGKQDAACYKQLWETILAGQVWHGEVVNKRKDGTLYTEEMTITPLTDAHGAITRFIAIKQNVTERRELDDALRRSEQQLTADLTGMQRLHEISTRFLASQGDLQSLLGSVLDAALAITAANKGHIQLLNAVTRELGITTQRGYDREFVEFFSHIGPGIAACGTAMQTRHCVVVEDLTVSPLFLAEPRALELMLAAGVRAVVCTPLLAHTGQLVGVLSAHFTAPHRPSERDLRLLDLLARQAADFVERTQAEAALRAAREELARANADLERKVQERTAKLRETIQELEGFSYSIVHDMRAPLRAMQTFATLAQEECAGCARPQSLDYFRRIRVAANRLDHLIQDALDYSKVVREELPLNPVDVAKLLCGICETYPNLQPPGVEISLQFERLVVLGNESALTQVFSNLLGNAVKFVKPGQKPHIRIWAEYRSREEAVQSAIRNTQKGDPPSRQLSTINYQLSTPQVVRIWVEDNGIGIPKQAHKKIFGMFQRMHRAEEYPGTGIGLAVVRKAMERMGGDVGLESEPGKGSRFWIELPKAAASTAGKERAA